jgi:hypothetical protein
MFKDCRHYLIACTADATCIMRLSVHLEDVYITAASDAATNATVDITLSLIRELK